MASHSDDDMSDRERSSSPGEQKQPESPQQARIPIIGQDPMLPQYFRLESERLANTDAVRRYNGDLAAGTLQQAPARRTSAETQAVVNQLGGADRGVFVNVGEIPAGLGRWEWLEDGIDNATAEEMGFDSPPQVEVARSDGIFTRGGYGQGAGPTTVWYPHAEYFDPAEQPDGLGRWEYHLRRHGNNDQMWAYTQFGGQVDTSRHRLYDSRNIPCPTAAQIWRVRVNHYITGGFQGDDPTDGINLVWIPAENDPHHTITLFETPPPSLDQPVEDPNHDNSTEGHSLGQRDPNSGLPHDPTNRGENIQTGDGTAAYHTRSIDGRNFTVDRSRAHHTIVEPHKCWVVNQKGQWQRYAGFKNIDWSDRNSVEKINKWKEQQMARNGWPQKRGEKRLPYLKEEKAWVNAKVEAADGGPLQESISRLAAEFNRRFTRYHRDEAGLYSLYDRLKREYAKHKAQAAEAEAAEAEGDGDEPPRKRRKTGEPGEDGDEQDESPEE